MAFDAGEIRGKLVVDKTQWDKSAKDIKASQKKMAAQTKKTGMAFKGMWKQVAVGIGVTHLLTSGMRAMVRQMGDTIKVGRTFEKEWANVTTMLSISQVETEKMRNELRMLSPTLGDTTELAKGMYQVLSASIEPAKAIEFLGKAAMSAKAGVTDTKTAVDALTTVINAYGMEAEAVTEISDIMFATVKRGKLTYGELAQSLGTIVPVAATVGVGFRDVAAAVATLTRQGVVASKATMQLRQVMMAVLKPSAEAVEITEKLEIGMGSMALETKGLAGWLTELKEKTKGNADIMTKIVPNVRALTAVMALAGKASESYAFDQEFMTETMGFTDEAFRKQMESVDFWVETFETAADKIKIAIYEGLVFSLRESIKTTEDFDETVTEATNNAANAVSLHVSTMVDVLGGLGRAWKKTDGFLFGWIDRLKGAKEGSDELAEAQILLTEAMARGGVEQIKATESIQGNTKAVEELAEETLTAAERMAMLDVAAVAFGQFRLDSQLEQLKQLAEETDDIAGEAILLEGQWKSSMSNMKDDTLNFMASIIPGIAFMTGNVGNSIVKMGEKTKATFGEIAADVGMTLHMIGSKNKAVSYASAIINTALAVSKALSAYSPPLSFLMAALQGAAGMAEVATIKEQSIPSAEKGAYLPSPTIIEAGHGPMGEVVLPLDKAPINMGGGTKVDLNFYAPIISTVGLSERDMDEAAEYLLDKMKGEIERYGGKLNA